MDAHNLSGQPGLVRLAPGQTLGATMKLFCHGDDVPDRPCCSLDSINDARRVCDRLGVPHYVLNLEDPFGRDVVRDFVEEYARGRTPIPCVRCNTFTKFRDLLKRGAALGCDAVETLWHPHRYGLVIVASEAEVLALAPDFAALAKEGDVLTIVSAPGDSTDIVSRVFAPGAGIDEDPVTGSAHAVMVPYWRERLGRDSFTAYQASTRGGNLTCRLDGDRVVLGGRCVSVIEGVLRL